MQISNCGCVKLWTITRKKCITRVWSFLRYRILNWYPVCDIWEENISMYKSFPPYSSVCMLALITIINADIIGDINIDIDTRRQFLTGNNNTISWNLSCKCTRNNGIIGNRWKCTRQSIGNHSNIYLLSIYRSIVVSFLSLSFFYHSSIATEKEKDECENWFSKYIQFMCHKHICRYTYIPFDLDILLYIINESDFGYTRPIVSIVVMQSPLKICI